VRNKIRTSRCKNDSKINRLTQFLNFLSQFLFQIKPTSLNCQKASKKFVKQGKKPKKNTRFVIFRAAEFDSSGFRTLLLSSEDGREFFKLNKYIFFKFFISDKLEKCQKVLRRTRNAAGDFEGLGRNEKSFGRESIQEKNFTS